MFYLNYGSREWPLVLNCSSWWGFQCFRVIYFLADIFLLKFYQNLLHPQECFARVTMVSTLCIIMEKCLRTTAVGQMLRCVYLVVCLFSKQNWLCLVNTLVILGVCIYIFVHIQWGLYIYIYTTYYDHLKVFAKIVSVSDVLNIL